MNARVRQTLNAVVEQFKTGNTPTAIAYATFPTPDIPSYYWFFMNRTPMFISGTGDARGYRQWQAVNRQVKKGSSAIYILVPCFKTRTDDETQETYQAIKYFKPSPVFRFEDTKGELLEHKQPEVPNLPLLDTAKRWGISVKAIPGEYKFYAYYSATRKEILLATSEEAVFFYELAHAAHERVKGYLEGGQVPSQEIVAELAAAALFRLVGKHTEQTVGNSYRYIESYAKIAKLTVHTACLKVLAETEKALNLILKGNCNEPGKEHSRNAADAKGSPEKRMSAPLAAIGYQG